MSINSNSKSCIVFAPHQDDATFGCGGTILSKRKAGFKVYVVCMTDGRNSHLFCFGKKSNPSPGELAVQRKNEEKKAMHALNVPEGNLIFLGFEDLVLFIHKRQASDLVAQIIQQLKPSEIFTPYIGDKHPDHIATHMIVRDSLNRSTIKPSVYQYFVWAVPNAKTRGNIVSVDISNELEAKKIAIMQYESQIISNFYPDQTRPVLTREFVSRFDNPKEVFIQENCASLKGLSKLWFSIRLYVYGYYFYVIKQLRSKL